jgi:hypothetical protein
MNSFVITKTHTLALSHKQMSKSTCQLCKKHTLIIDLIKISIGLYIVYSLPFKIFRNVLCHIELNLFKALLLVFVVNGNILTIDYSLIMWFNILLFIYTILLILTYYINKKVNPNKYPFRNPYMPQYNIYSNLKTKFRLHGIENIKQKKTQ